MRRLLIAAMLLTPVSAAAGTLTGTITVQGGGALASAQVRLWVEGTKGWSIQTTTTANGSGVYSFTGLAADDYLIDALGPDPTSNYGDRWYDVVAPFSSGYVGESADLIAVPASGTVSGKDVALEVVGGANGFVFLPSSAVAPGMMVRMERGMDPRIHHNDQSKNPTGFTGFFGMPPGNDYHVMVYDPSGTRETLLSGSTFSVTSGVQGSIGNFTLANAAADPYEGNNTANCGSPSITGVPFNSTNARIGSLGADADWFCYTATEGDRLFVEATTQFTFFSATRYSPWTDPMLSFWRGGVKLVEDDDGGTGPFDSLVDTGPLQAGCHCAAVTAFGDGDYNGSGGGSTGRYQLRVTMGNRPPVLSIKKGATEVPAAPMTFSIDEGDTLSLTLAYPDADGTLPTKSFTHKDSASADVTDGTLVLNNTTGTYTWTAGANASANSPYTLVLTAADAEFTPSKTVTLIVDAVNMPPETPVPISPIDDAVVTAGDTPLVWNAAADPEGDTVSYDVELYENDTSGLPAQYTNRATTSWTPTALAENTRAFWRVRSRDASNALSPWSELEGYLVDTANDPPETPILIKPAEGELVTVRRPALSVLNVMDPEDDDVEFIFQIARDVDFSVVVWTSVVVPQNVLAGTTMTTADMDLDWGYEFYARVMAQDVRGGLSEWSDAHKFRLKDNVAPTATSLECDPQTYTEEPPTEVVVSNVEDPEGEVVTFELEMFDFDDDPSTADPVYTTSTEMDTSGVSTTIPIDLTDVPNGHYRYRVRAFDGTDGSDWVECELTLELPEMEMGSPDGGCCDAGTRPTGAGVLVLVVLFGLARPRRR